VLIVLLPLAQGVGAAIFFDSRIILHSKADPVLRNLLGRAYFGYEKPFNVMVSFLDVPSPGELNSLRSLGTVRTFTGHVATMTLSQDALQKLASFDFVDHITAPKKLKPQLDESVPDILANQVWTKVKDSSGNAVNGTGVIIGTVDTGIDSLHKDFYFSNGTSKILYIWDQSIEGTHPDGFTYGNECIPNQIQAHYCPEFDGAPWTSLPGHGTAVASIAASTGLASGKFVGVAPGAYIISVKLADGYEDHVLDGFNYLVTKARELGMPLVINYSFGESTGSHDGTEPLELALTDLADQGTPIVVASGNDRNTDIHVDGRLGPGQHVAVTWSNEAAKEGFVDLWYSSLDTVVISVRTPRGDIVSGPTSDTGVRTSDGNVIVSSDQRKTGKEWYIDVTPLPGNHLDNSVWTFVLTGVGIFDGKWDAWTEPGKFTPSVDKINNPYVIDPFDTIDYPGTSRGVITVGSYETRYWWLGRCTPCIQFNNQNGYQGNWSFGQNYASGVGDLAYSSGAGPTRDGRSKPEIVAPGVNIVAALATNIPLVSENHPNLDEPDNSHGVWQGSSFAAPHVAGVIALMLQMNRYLTPNEIKNLLIEGARQDKFTGTLDARVGSPLWGWGKVNALTSTLDAPTLYSVRVEMLPTAEELQANLTVDGHNTVGIPLNQTKTLIFEFTRNGTHTIELPPFIQVSRGVRYGVDGTPWQFSSGGSRVFQYRLQYLLEVNSQYGQVAGAGWYYANSTAEVTVAPITVEGHRFAGWSGSANSESPTAQIKMDSPKQVTAEWVTELPTSPQISMGIMLALAAIICIVLFSVLRAKGHLRKHSLRARSTLQRLYGL